MFRTYKQELWTVEVSWRHGAQVKRGDQKQYPDGPTHQTDNGHTPLNLPGT